MKNRVRLIIIVLFCLLLTASRLPADSRGVKGTVSVKSDTGRTITLYKASYALVIGNGNYKNGWDILPGAIRDAEEVAAALRKTGFNVTLKTDITKNTFDKTLNEFSIRYGKKESSRLLFYYSGHGFSQKMVTGEDLGYLVMTDSPLPEKDMVGFELRNVDMASIITQAKKIRSRHVLFMFDSCFSGSILNLRDRVVPQSISDNIRYPVRQFITAGRANEPVPDQSVFKQAFLDILEGRDREPVPDGYLTGEELGLYLKTKVPEYNPAQHPQYGKIRDPKLDKGDFVFVLNNTKQMPVNLPSSEIFRQPIAEKEEQQKRFLEEQKVPEFEKEKLEADRYEDLEGVWEDEDGYQHTIQRIENRYTVVSLVGLNGKPCEISDTEWSPGTLKWTFHVPWSGHTLRYTTKTIGKNHLECHWKGPDGSGTDVLRRIR